MPPTSASGRLKEINSRDDAAQARLDAEQLALERLLVPKLAKRAYHLKKTNSWFQDWLQFQRNTHPVFGLCCHHPLHPVRAPERALILVGSVAVGLTVTNVVYLGLLGDEVAGGTTRLSGDTVGLDVSYEVRTSLIFLWTVGSFVHSCFDIFIWNLTACRCFRPGGEAFRSTFCQKFGVYLSVLIVAGAVFVATTMVLIRMITDTVLIRMANDTSSDEAAAEATEEAESPDATNPIGEYIDRGGRYSFLVAYFFELVFALFGFYFVTSTIFFSGVLACCTGRVPLIGGRPREVLREKEKATKALAANRRSARNANPV